MEEARAALAALTAAHPAWIAAVEADADLAAMEGRAADALERYRKLVRLAPKDQRAPGACRDPPGAGRGREAARGGDRPRLGGPRRRKARRALPSPARAVVARRSRASRSRRRGRGQERGRLDLGEGGEEAGSVRPRRRGLRRGGGGEGGALGRRRQPLRGARRDRSGLRVEGRGGAGRVQGAEPPGGGAARGGIGAADPRAARFSALVDGPRVSGRARPAGRGDRGGRRRPLRPHVAREGHRPRVLRRFGRDPPRRGGLGRFPGRDGRGPSKGRAPGGPRAAAERVPGRRARRSPPFFPIAGYSATRRPET